MSTEKRILVCDVCGTNDITMLAWVDANTKEYVDEYHDETMYCGYCETETTVSLIIEDENGNITPTENENLLKDPITLDKVNLGN